MYDKVIVEFNNIFKADIKDAYNLIIPKESTDEQIINFISFCKKLYGKYFLSFYALIEMEVNE